MSDKELLDFVMAYCDGRIFTSAKVPANILHLVFMPLSLAKLDLDAETIGILWEYTNAPTAGRAINGFPMFASVRFMHKLDVERAQAAIDKELARRKAVTL